MKETLFSSTPPAKVHSFLPLPENLLYEKPRSEFSFFSVAEPEPISSMAGGMEGEALGRQTSWSSAAAARDPHVALFVR